MPKVSSSMRPSLRQVKDPRTQILLQLDLHTAVSHRRIRRNLAQRPCTVACRVLIILSRTLHSTTVVHLRGRASLPTELSRTVVVPKCQASRVLVARWLTVKMLRLITPIKSPIRESRIFNHRAIRSQRMHRIRSSSTNSRTELLREAPKA